LIALFSATEAEAAVESTGTVTLYGSPFAAAGLAGAGLAAPAWTGGFGAAPSSQAATAIATIRRKERINSLLVVGNYKGRNDPAKV
jgi:hypothetical protein